mmetsp:Transcript_21752/g.45700  ORF Transcript_21752/g.45700 Transcript_21752/m.45700 type:complete len:172 (+) Transcript_21752:152-667(+)
MTAINSTTAESSVYHRWTPLNHHKNESITIVLECGWDGKRFTVPAQPPKSDDAVADYFNEPNGSDETVLLGSTTLYDVVKRVKSQIPTLYLMQEQGGAVLSCGSKEVHSGEWETTMLCQLIYDQEDDKAISKLKLDDGRDAVLVYVGQKVDSKDQKSTVVQRCLAKGNLYG